jgi:Cu/Ag efflux protein CusF
LKKAIAIFFAVLLVLCLAGVSFARMGGMHRAMEEMAVREVAGVVESVDVKAKTVTVKGMSGPVTATCDDRTVVKMGDEIKTLSDVKVGDKAALFFEVGESSNLAKSIIITPPASAPAEKKNMEPAKP